MERLLINDWMQSDLGESSRLDRTYMVDLIDWALESGILARAAPGKD
jgi:hypothetical protein